MMRPPEQVPSEGNGKWESWQDHKLDDKSSEFSYSDSTEEHIGSGQSQKFHYEGNDLPEKM